MSIQLRNVLIFLNHRYSSNQSILKSGDMVIPYVQYKAFDITLI